MLRSLGVVVIAISLATGAAFGDAKPIVFQNLPVDAAKALAKKQGKLLLVDATAVWCGPCKVMDRQTWSNDEVFAWIKANAVAVQIDVDEQEELAQALKIQAMPTVIVFQDGNEIDRSQGLKGPEEFLLWMNEVQQGRTAAAALAEHRAAVQQGKPQDMKERLNQARQLHQAKQFDEAMEEYAWLWRNMVKVDRQMYGVRESWLASFMQDLVTQHEPAKVRFAQLRDEEESRFAGPHGAFADRHDWVLLNNIIQDDQRVLDWFDSVKTDDSRLRSMKLYERELAEVFERNSRWADRAALLGGPEAFFRKQLQYHMLVSPGAGRRGAEEGAVRVSQLDERMASMFREQIAKGYASLLAADQEVSAAWLVNAFTEYDPSPAGQIKLVEWALIAEEPREEHRAWLKDAAERGGDTEIVEQRLEEALVKPATE